MEKLRLSPRYIVLVAGLLLTSCSLAAGNVTGKWVGKFHILPQGGGPREDKAVVILKQQGEEVTGTLGETDESKQMPLKKGKITGNSLKIEMEGNPIVFTLTLDGDKLTGEIRDAHDESKVLARVDLKRG
jgi:hypothetical protein